MPHFHNCLTLLHLPHLQVEAEIIQLPALTDRPIESVIYPHCWNIHRISCLGLDVLLPASSFFHLPSHVRVLPDGLTRVTVELREIHNLLLQMTNITVEVCVNGTAESSFLPQFSFCLSEPCSTTTHFTFLLPTARRIQLCYRKSKDCSK